MIDSVKPQMELLIPNSKTEYAEGETIGPITIKITPSLTKAAKSFCQYDIHLFGDDKSWNWISSKDEIYIANKNMAYIQTLIRIAGYPEDLTQGAYKLEVKCVLRETDREKVSKLEDIQAEINGVNSASVEFQVTAVKVVGRGRDSQNLRLTEDGSLAVELMRGSADWTDDEILWAVIQRNDSLYNDLEKSLDNLFFPLKGSSPFQGVDTYDKLQEIVSDWMKDNMSTTWDINKAIENIRVESEKRRLEKNAAGNKNAMALHPAAGGPTDYLKMIVQNGHIPKATKDFPDGYIEDRYKYPALCELIWSYWHEEGMLIQTMQAICLRFQNKLINAGNDPLSSLNTNPLRPLSNLIWGYIQSEYKRLSVRRRNYEYDHSYGIFLHGKAVRDFQPADSRKTFMAAFNRLMYLLSHFYRQKDDTTIKADAFPIKNALRDIHIILAEGAHNQFGDMPWKAREEMFIEQYIVGRPEMREFLGGRSMVPYPERWMENVDTMKRIQGWTDVSVQHFNTLARSGENLILSIRHGAWNKPEITADNADNWAVAHRQIAQEYMYSYRAAAGIDLTDKDQVDDAAPSVHLVKQLEKQTGRPV